ncbi:hypothetical protein K439DRAFT_578113 [Ramaria rubella]|nr:hypothetical protein K439DRAFT_578113 [Ramaria rubella]
MPTLPPEILEKIFSQLPMHDLTCVALTSRLFYHLSLIPLYRKIIHIQLFGRDDQVHSPSNKCLESLSLSGNGSQAVRHFAARGHPWLHEVTIEMLYQALFCMQNLISLELNLGTLPEELIFTTSNCSMPSFLPHLRALNLQEYSSSIHLLTGRSLEIIRIRAEGDAVTFSELLSALRLCSSSLTSLQIRVSAPDVASAVVMVDKLAHLLPLLSTFSITFTFPTPRWTEHFSVSGTCALRFELI